MNHKLILAAFIFCALIFLSNKGGRNQESTGAPFETDKFACAECHSGGSFTPEVEVVLKDQNNSIVNQYIAGGDYTIEMKITSTTGKPSYYGFQAVVVDQKQNQAGSFLALGDKVRKLTIAERIYLMQISPRPDGLYTAKWKATAEDTATVYIAGLAANGNNGTGGDKTKVASFSFTKSIINSTSDLYIKKHALLQSNLINTTLIFKQEVSNVLVFDLSGNLLKRVNSDYNVSELNLGLFIVQYQYNGKVHAEKFIKM